MLSTLLISLFGLFHLNPAAPIKMPQDTVTIYGVCWDVSTGIDIKVKASALLKNGKINLGESNEEGKFELRLPESAQHVVFEREGYRTEILPVNFIGKMENHFRFVMHVEMIKKDSQQVNKVLFTEVNNPVKLSPQSKKLFFEVREAKNRRLLRAKVCLNFTQTGKVECYDTDTTKNNAPILIEAQEKVSIIVSAPGYKDYIGNLMNGQPENSEEFYQIRLLSEVSILSMHLPEPGSSPVSYFLSGTKEDKFENNLWIGGKNGRWFDYWPFTRPGVHYITATLGSAILMDQSLAIVRGLNFMAPQAKVPENLMIATTKAPEKPGQQPVLNSITVVAKKQPINSRTYDSTVLYFDQSSYHLRNATKLTLDSVAQLLANQKQLTISITGHSDNVGKQDLNVILSEYRARVVTNYSKENGVHPTQLSYNWKGPDAPAALNDTPENKMKNRRVVIRYGEM